MEEVRAEKYEVVVFMSHYIECCPTCGSGNHP
jgi:hypothetical protein